MRSLSDLLMFMVYIGIPLRIFVAHGTVVPSFYGQIVTTDTTTHKRKPYDLAILIKLISPDHCLM